MGDVGFLISDVETLKILLTHKDLQKRLASNQQPATSNQQPAVTSNQSPLTRHQTPATSNQ